MKKLMRDGLALAYDEEAGTLHRHASSDRS
jgi:hypothetical protein